MAFDIFSRLEKQNNEQSIGGICLASDEGELEMVGGIDAGLFEERLKKLDRFVEELGFKAGLSNEETGKSKIVDKHIGNFRTLVSETRSEAERVSRISLENSKLTEQIAELERMLNSEKKHRLEAENILKVTKDTLRDTRAGLQKAHLDISAHTRQLQFLKQHDVENKSRILEQDAELDVSRRTIDQLETQLESAQDTALDLDQQLDDKTTKHKALETTVTRLQELMEADTNHREKLGEELRETLSEKLSTEAENVKLASKLDLALEELKTFRDASSEELFLRDKLINQREAKVDILERDLSSLREENLTLISTQERLEKIVSEQEYLQVKHENFMLQVNEEEAERQGKMLTDLTKITEQAHKIDSLANSNRELKALVAKEKVKYGALNKDKQALARRVKRLEGGLMRDKDVAETGDQRRAGAGKKRA